MRKILSILISFLLLFGLLGCNGSSVDSSVTDSATDVEISASSLVSDNISNDSNESKEPSIDNNLFEEYVEKYEEIIKDFKTLVNFRTSDNFEDKWNNDEEIPLSEALNTAITEFESINEDKSFHWSNTIVDLPNVDKSINTKDFGYVLYDINGDKIPELFWVRSDHTVLALFTLSPENSDKIILLDAFWQRYKCYPLEDKLYTWGSGGAMNNYCDFYELTSDGKLKETYSFKSELNEVGNKVFFYENSYEITEQRFDELSNNFPKTLSDSWLRTRIVPLA